MFGFNDVVTHIPTGLLYLIDISSSGVRYSDGEEYWYNVIAIGGDVNCMEDTFSAGHVHLTALQEKELKMYKQCCNNRHE